jgi:hypothetical protein
LSCVKSAGIEVSNSTASWASNLSLHNSNLFVLLICKFCRRLALHAAEQKIKYLVAREKTSCSESAKDLMEFFGCFNDCNGNGAIKNEAGENDAKNEAGENEAEQKESVVMSLIGKLSEIGIKERSQLVNMDDDDLKFLKSGLPIIEGWALFKALQQVRVSKLPAKGEF